MLYFDFYATITMGIKTIFILLHLNDIQFFGKSDFLLCYVDMNVNAVVLWEFLILHL